MNSCPSKLMRLNGKKLSVKLKYGSTIDDLAREYDCQKEELLEFLKKNFDKSAYNRIINEMTKNSKKKNHNKKSSLSISTDDEAITTIWKDDTAITTVPEDDTTIATVQEDDTTITTVQEKNEATEEQFPILHFQASSLDEESLLQKLKDEEKILRHELISKENEHRNLITKKKNLINKLENQQALMLELRKTIEQRQKDVEQISNDLDNLSEELVSINSSISNGRKDLLDIQGKIKELEKIYVFVYENGETDTGNFCIDIPETWNKVFDDILRNDIVEDLSIKQIKQLAKLIVLTDILNQNSLIFELTFESENAQKAFYELIKVMS